MRSADRSLRSSGPNTSVWSSRWDWSLTGRPAVFGFVDKQLSVISIAEHLFSSCSCCWSEVFLSCTCWCLCRQKHKHLRPVSPDSRRNERLQTGELVSVSENMLTCQVTSCRSGWGPMTFTDPGDGVLAVIFSQRVAVAASTPPTVPSDLQRVEPVRLGSVGLQLRYTWTSRLSQSDFYKKKTTLKCSI